MGIPAQWLAVTLLRNRKYLTVNHGIWSQRAFTLRCKLRRFSRMDCPECGAAGSYANYVKPSHQRLTLQRPPWSRSCRQAVRGKSFSKQQRKYVSGVQHLVWCICQGQDNGCIERNRAENQSSKARNTGCSSWVAFLVVWCALSEAIHKPSPAAGDDLVRVTGTKHTKHWWHTKRGTSPLFYWHNARPLD